MAAEESDQLSTERVSTARWMINAVKWVVIQRTFIYSFGLISMLFLARIIPPADFGMVTLAAATLGYLRLVFGIDPKMVLVQKETVSDKHFNAAWAMLLFQGTIILIVSLIFATDIARIMGEPRLVPVIKTIGLALFLEYACNPYILTLLRKMDYRTDTIYLVLPKVAQLVTSVFVAYLIWSDYRALICGIIFYWITLLFLSFTLFPKKPRISFVGMKDLIHVSYWVMLSNIVSHIIRSVDTVILGRFVGSSAVSHMAASHRFSNIACVDIAELLKRLFLPGFASLQSDRYELGRQLAVAFSMISLITMPLALAVGLCAKYLVLLVLGWQWVDAIPVLGILWVFGMFYGYHILLSSVLFGMGKYERVVICKTRVVVPSIAVIYVCVTNFGLIGAAYGMSIMGVALFITILFEARKQLGFSFHTFFATIQRIPFALAAMSLTIGFVDKTLPPSLGAFDAASNLIINFFCGMVAYIVTILILWVVYGKPEGPEKRLLELVQNWFTRKRIAR